jgi:hypothetical protein
LASQQRTTVVDHRPPRGREHRIADLRAAEATESSEVERDKALLLAIDKSLTSNEQLLSEVTVLERGAPSNELESANRRAVEAAEDARQHWEEGKRIGAMIGNQPFLRNYPYLLGLFITGINRRVGGLL